jgi:hypothetical protein
MGYYVVEDRASMAKEDQEKPSNYEARLLRLLNLKSLADLNRVLSEPPNEQSLQEMGPPSELYELEWEDDLVDSALDEIERAEADGTEAIFVTKGGAIAMCRIPTPPASELRMVRELSGGDGRILSEPLKPDSCHYTLVMFATGFVCAEYPIYEEVQPRLVE